jgi:hypothetical protein
VQIELINPSSEVGSRLAYYYVPLIQCRLANNPSQNKQGDIMVTQSDKPSIDPVQRCDLCEQKINPTVKIYNNDIRLCKACFGHMENLPEVVAKSVERFLIGNVV